MAKSVLYMSISLDGFITGPHDGPGNGLGDGAHRLHGGFAGRPDGTIDWLTGRDNGHQRLRLMLEGAPGTEGESRWES